MQANGRWHLLRGSLFFYHGFISFDLFFVERLAGGAEAGGLTGSCELTLFGCLPSPTLSVELSGAPGLSEGMARAFPESPSAATCTLSTGTRRCVTGPNAGSPWASAVVAIVLLSNIGNMKLGILTISTSLLSERYLCSETADGQPEHFPEVVAASSRLHSCSHKVRVLPRSITTSFLKANAERLVATLWERSDWPVR
jgi:hypothetical protein